MALVKDIVARFKVESSEYLAKLDEAKSKNKDLATQLIATAGSADKAIATLQSAKSRKALSEFGIDPRQVGGVIGEIRKLDKAIGAAADTSEELQKRLKFEADRAGGLDDVVGSFREFSSGNFLGGIEKLKKGIADLVETKGFGGMALRAGLVATAIHLAGGAAANVTGKALELREALQRGEITAGQMGMQLAGGLPILGGWVTAAANLYEWFTGSAAELARIKALEKEILAYKESQAAAQDGLNKTSKRWATELQDVRNEAHALFLEMNGQFDEAKEFRIKVKMESEVQSAKDRIADSYEARQQEIRKALVGRNENGNTLAMRIIDADAKGQTKELERLVTLKAELEKESRELQTRMEREQAEIAIAIMERQENEKTITAQEGEKKRQKFAIDEAKKTFEQMKGLFKGGLGGEAPGSDTVDQMGKALDAMKGKADALKDSLKTPTDKLKDKVAEAMKLRTLGLIGNAEIDKLLTNDAVALQNEANGIATARNVYDLPNVSEIRSGSTLYAPPTKADEKAVKRLEEIKALLAAIKDQARTAGVVIEEIK